MIRIIVILFTFLVVHNSALNGQCDTKCYSLKPFPQDLTIDYKKTNVYTEKSRFFETSMPYTAFNYGNEDRTVLIRADRYIIYNGNSYYKNLILYDIASKQIIDTIITPYFTPFYHIPIVVADIDGDCEVDIFIATSSFIYNDPKERKKILCYTMNGALKWISDVEYGLDKSSEAGLLMTLSVADFNHDGISEVYLGNEIFNGMTGVKLCESKDNRNLFTMSIAANIDDDENLELVMGYTIYKVNIVNPDSLDGNTMIAYNFDINGKYYDGYASLADVNNDGRLDVIVNPQFQNEMGIYIYTFINDSFHLLSKTSNEKFPYYWDGGPVSIYKNRQDSNMNFIFKSLFDGNVLKNYELDGDTIKLKWIQKMNENSDIGYVSIYDFNNDGNYEIVFHDTDSLFVVTERKGKPVKLYSYPCISGTAHEYPLIVGFGNNTKICITCTDRNYDNGRLTIFGPPEGQRWAPAR
ncbi:MAG TPA: VCBS repeat-containing protein, partial [Saprospiraceae bacterium]|nr:VCBS repeat-containing protein [Saprospiraceae bacterium]HRP43110.1 VCBS repeat-containing protein [Saprospiraceae bacterium]